MNGEATYVSYFGQVSKGEVKNVDFICYENCPTESGEIMKALAWFAIKNYAINKYQRKQQAEMQVQSQQPNRYEASRKEAARQANRRTRTVTAKYTPTDC